LEDFVSVINGRDTIVEEIKSSDPELQQFLSDKIASLLKEPRFVESLEGHLADEADTSARKKMLIKRLKQICK
jgi:hypothetical protein